MPFSVEPLQQAEDGGLVALVGEARRGGEFSQGHRAVGFQQGGQQLLKRVGPAQAGARGSDRDGCRWRAGREVGHGIVRKTSLGSGGRRWRRADLRDRRRARRCGRAGVRWKKPCMMRNGSWTSSMVAGSSPTATASELRPTGPPSNLWMIVFEDALVHFVEAVRVDLDHGQRGVGDLASDRCRRPRTWA